MTNETESAVETLWFWQKQHERYVKIWAKKRQFTPIHIRSL